MRKAFVPQESAVKNHESDQVVLLETQVITAPPQRKVIPLKIRMRSTPDCTEIECTSTELVPPEEAPVFQHDEEAYESPLPPEDLDVVVDEPIPVPQADEVVENGTVIDKRFKIMGLIKEDRLRRVYLAVDVRGTQSPVKLYQLKTPAMDPDAYDEKMKRFQKILRNLTIYKHPHVAEVRAFFQWNGSHFYAIDYTSGMNLTSILTANRGPLAEEEAADIGIALCDALEFLQFRGIPFFPDKTDSGDVIVSEKGVLKLSKYNLHLLFDPYSSMALMPRRSEHFYDWITWVTRMSYYLLTGKEYGDDKETRNQLKRMGKNMAKVFETTCPPGQKAVGDIRVLRKMLEKAPIRTKESNKDILKFAWKFMKAG